MATKTRKKKAATKKGVIVGKPVRGLHGAGLIRLGDESRLELRDRLQMARNMFGRVVNVSERTIAKVESSAENAEKLQRPYNEMYRLVEALSEVLDPNSLGAWMQTRNDAFGGRRPIEVIEHGEIDLLWEMFYRLRSGMPG